MSVSIGQPRWASGLYQLAKAARRWVKLTAIGLLIGGCGGQVSEATDEVVYDEIAPAADVTLFADEILFAEETDELFEEPENAAPLESPPPSNTIVTLSNDSTEDDQPGASTGDCECLTQDSCDCFDGED